VLYTPGHASHHGSFLDRSSGIALVGDVAGIRITGPRRYAEFVDRELQRHLSGPRSLPHRVGATFELSWLGLARYWRKRGVP